MIYPADPGEVPKLPPASARKRDHKTARAHDEETEEVAQALMPRLGEPANYPRRDCTESDRASAVERESRQ